MSEHTPSPWIIGEDGDVFDSDGCTCIALVCGAADENPTKEVIANAALIAAAPELLRAALHWSVCDFPDEVDFRCEGCNAARKAIAKAEGRIQE